MSAVFPHDLLHVQREWHHVYRALATTPRTQSTTALRRRLLLLSVRLRWHPYWRTVPAVPAARTELRRLARTATTGWRA